jgi:hypothetical protein
MKKLIACAALLLPAAVLAAGMQPGNYEFTTKMEMPGMPFAMPPVTSKQCLEAEDLAQNEQYQPGAGAGEDCEVKNLKQAGGKTTFDLACKDGTTAKAEYAVTDTGMTGKTVMNREGQAITMNVSARRVGDCK